MERYELVWPGKRAAMLEADTPTAMMLRPVPEQSVDFDTTGHLFIEGDNLDALKLLQPSYAGSVRLIYVDPPYNTGSDRLYNDAFAQSSWLSMIYPRLKLARDLLADDGLLVISVDDGEHAGLVEVGKELFGAGNYLASVARVTKKTSNKGTHFAPSKDYLVCIARNASALGPLMDEVPQTYRKRFSGRDHRGSFATVGLYQASLDPLRGCANQRYWIECPDGSHALPPGPRRPAVVADAVNRPPESREDRVWRWSHQSYLGQKDRLVFKETATSPLQDEHGNQSRWNVYTKYYLQDRLEAGIRPRDFIDGITNDLGTKALIELGMETYFDFAKPPQLIQRLLTWVADPQALVLDFFAGSGTTAQAVLAQNAADGGRRRYICVQIAEPLAARSEASRAGFDSIADLARERIRRAGRLVRERAGDQADGAGGAGGLDTGFRALRVEPREPRDDNTI